MGLPCPCSSPKVTMSAGSKARALSPSRLPGSAVPALPCTGDLKGLIAGHPSVIAEATAEHRPPEHSKPLCRGLSREHPWRDLRGSVAPRRGEPLWSCCLHGPEQRPELGVRPLPARGSVWGLTLGRNPDPGRARAAALGSLLVAPKHAHLGSPSTASLGPGYLQ